MFDPSKHLIRVQGNREYLPVAWRLVWFREAYPDWGIHTSIYHLDLERQIAICRAEILDAADRIVATATKREDIKGFPDYIEKAETGAIGRALALCGFGTQFAPELEEADRLADAPAPGNGKPAPPVTNPQTVPKPAPGAQSAPKPISHAPL